MLFNLIFLPLISFCVSFFTSQAGISGAFFLLPIQISFLGINSPVASSTNLMYNVIATPSGVYRYLREGRLETRLTALILSGTIPGMLTGVYVRTNFMLSPVKFKIFAGAVLLYMSFRLIFFRKNTSKLKEKNKIKRISAKKLFPVAYIIGVVAGAYGVGGGAFLSPLLVSFFSISVYYVSGATLLSTFVTSLLSVLFYSFYGFFPDLSVALAFGIGGVVGTYAGAKYQTRFSEKTIRTILSLVILLVSIKYLLYIRFFIHF